MASHPNKAPSQNKENGPASDDKGDSSPFCLSKKSCCGRCRCVGLMIGCLFLSPFVIFAILAAAGPFHAVIINKAFSAEIYRLKENVSHNDRQVSDLTVLAKQQTGSLAQIGVGVRMLRRKINNLESTVSKHGSLYASLRVDLQDVQNQHALQQPLSPFVVHRHVTTMQSEEDITTLITAKVSDLTVLAKQHNGSLAQIGVGVRMLRTKINNLESTVSKHGSLYASLRVDLQDVQNQIKSQATKASKKEARLGTDLDELRRDFNNLKAYVNSKRSSSSPSSGGSSLHGGRNGFASWKASVNYYVAPKVQNGLLLVVQFFLGYKLEVLDILGVCLLPLLSTVVIFGL